MSPEQLVTTPNPALPYQQKNREVVVPFVPEPAPLLEYPLERVKRWREAVSSGVKETFLPEATYHGKHRGEPRPLGIFAVSSTGTMQKRSERGALSILPLDRHSHKDSYHLGNELHATPEDDANHIEKKRKDKLGLALGALVVAGWVGKKVADARAARRRRNKEKGIVSDNSFAHSPTYGHLPESAVLTAKKSERSEPKQETEAERIERKNRNIVVTVGALALAGAGAYLLWKHGVDFGGGNGGRPGGESSTVPTSPLHTGPPTILEPKTPILPPSGSEEALKQGIGHFSSGDNPWDEGIDYANWLHYNVSNNDPNDVYFIDAIKDDLLRLNATSEAGAHHIAIGTDWKLPSPERMAELFRLYGNKS